MSAYIGIDLGTTFSAVARLDEMGRAAIVHFSDGSNILPSIVSFKTANDIETGILKALDDPGEVVAHRFKREMGTDWLFDAHGKPFSATDLSAFVLKKIKQEVDKACGGIVEAVVTVPANFANDARDATMKAAQMAGINVKYIINEPTAAALFFAAEQKGDAGGTYAIYDLGGGTFDMSIIKLTGEDVEVLATDGIHKLGGRDFDDALTTLVSKKFKAATGEELEFEDFTPNDAEDLKKSLTDREVAKVRINRTNIEVTRGEFEEVISSSIAQAEMLCESVMDEADVAPAEIRDIILVGGSSRMPIISKSIERVFGKEPKRFGNPDEVVALGAALYAAYKSDKSGMNQVQLDAVNSINVSEVTNKYFGTSALTHNATTGQMVLANSIIINKGQKIPCSVTQEYSTVSDDQRKMELDITESNAPETDLNFVNIVWRGELDLPPDRPRGQKIEITYSYDENQVVHAKFLDVESGNFHEVDIQAGADAKDAIDINEFLVE